MLTEELLQFVVERMNNYVQKVIPGKTTSRRSRFKSWKATPNLEDYWSRDQFIQSSSMKT